MVTKGGRRWSGLRPRASSTPLFPPQSPSLDSPSPGYRVQSSPRASLHSKPGFCSPQLHPRLSEALLSTPVTPVCRRGCPDGEDEHRGLSGLPSGLASIHPSLSSCSVLPRDGELDPSLCTEEQESGSGPLLPPVLCLGSPSALCPVSCSHQASSHS